MFEYVDVDYLSNPYKVLSQMRYVFIYGGTTISWRSIKQIMETCGLSSIRGNITKLIMLQALHKLTNDTLKMIELSIYRPSLLLSLTLEEWWNCYSTTDIKWQFSRSINKDIVNCNTRETHWNTLTQRSPCYATRENIIMSTWRETNW